MKEKKQSKIFEVFESLNRTAIKYCHWKSNAHLDCSFKSECDFDLLVAYEDASKFITFLTEHNFKKKFSSPNYVYPGFDDYFLFDKQTGHIFHFHIHFKLIIGRKHQKNYRIPIENLALQTSVMHSHFPIKTILPEVEIWILFIRSFLKFQLDLRTLKRIILKLWWMLSQQTRSISG